MKRRRLALFLALTLAFTSVDSVSLVAGAAEEVQIIDESAELDSAAVELPPETEAVLDAGQDSVEFTQETIASEAITEVSVPEMPAEESSTEMPTEVPMTEMLQEEPITEAQTEALVTEESEVEILAEDVPEEQPESEAETTGVFEDIVDSQSGDGVVIEDIDIVAETAELAVQNTGTPWDGTAMAEPLALGGSINAELNGEVTEKWFSFTPTKTGRYAFHTMSEGNPYLYVALYTETGAHIDWRSGYVSLLHSHELNAETLYYYRISSDGNPMKFTVSIAEAVEVESAAKISVKNTFVEKLESIVAYAKFSLTFSNGDTQELSFDESNTAYDKYGNEHTCKITDTAGNPINEYELTPGKYQMIFSYEGKGDYHTEPITVTSLNDFECTELRDGLNHVISGSEYGEWLFYKFTPSQTGKYHFTPVNSMVMYDSEGQWIDRFNTELQDGNTYYITLKGSIWSGEAQDSVYEWDMNIFIVPEVKSAKLLSIKTKYVYPFERVDQFDGNFEVTYTNGKTETVSLSNDWNLTDEMGVRYTDTVCDASGKILDASMVTAPGEYTRTITSGSTTVYEGKFKVLSLDYLPEIEEGTHIVEVDKDYQNKEYYRFIPKKSGTYQISCTDGGRDVYDAEGNGIYENILTLKGGNAYYIGFYNWNGGAQTEKSVTISYVPVPESAKIISGKTTFIDGIESVEEHQTVLELMYSDDTTGTIDIYGSGSFDANGVYIRCTIEAADKTSYEVYDDIPVGKYNLVFICEGKELCRQQIKVVSLTDIVSDTLKEGSNFVESGVADWKVYSFTPEAAGKYEFTPCSEISIYQNDGGFTEIDSGMNGYALERKKTYYVLLRGSIKDGWDDVYSWNMNVTRVPEVEYIELSPADTKFTLIADGDSIDRILSSDKYSLKITYTDRSVKEISLNRAFDEMTDAETGKYVSEYTKTPGKYNLHFVFEGKELKVPVELKAISEFVSDTWDLLNPLTVDNSDEFAIYKVTGGTETTSYMLESDTKFWGALYEENGSIVKHMYRDYEQKLELPAGVTYYLKLNAEESVKQYTVAASAKKGAEIAELRAMTSRETYLADFDNLTSNDVAAKMIYDDETSRTVYGDSRAVLYDIKSSSNPEQTYGLYDILPAGSYSVVPRVTSGSAVSMKTVSTPIEAVPLDLSSLETIAVDEQVDLKTPNSRNMYRFSPEKDGSYELTDAKSDVYAYSYDANTKQWDEMPYRWQMKAGETYVITAYDPFMIQKYSESAPNPGEDETSKGGSLTLDKMEHVVIAKSGDTVNYTFTPEKSGKYLIESSSVENAEEDTVVTLYQGNNRIAQDDDGGSDSNFRLLHYLEAGIEYTYEVGLYSGIGKFNICLTAVSDRLIQKLDIDEIGENMDGTLDQDSCYMLVSYTDGTTNRLRIGTAQDDYGNEFTYMTKLMKEEEKQRTYRIGVRYRAKGTTEWKTVERDVTLLTIEGRVLGNAVLGAAVVRDVFDSEDEGRDYYRLRVTESGDYNTVTTFDGSIDVYGDSIVDEEMTYVTHLEAGKTYYLCVEWEKYGENSGAPDSYSVTVYRNKEVAGIEIVGEPKVGYRRLSQYDSAFYRSIKIKVNYQDESSEVVYGNEPVLSDGSVVSIAYKEINDTKMRLEVELSGHRATKVVPVKDPAQAPLMQASDNGYTFSSMNTAYGDTCVMRVIPKQTENYTVKLTTDGAAEDTFVWATVYSSNLFVLYNVGSEGLGSIKLEAGKEYYIAATPHSVGAVGSINFYVSLLSDNSSHTCEWVESTILKKPTCGADGVQKYVCRICGGEKTVVLPATGEHKLVNKTDVAATCGTAGKQHRECTVCGYKETAVVIPATEAHKLINKVDKAATCGVPGSQHRQCTVCGYKEAATVIPATGKHSYGDYSDTKAPTALEEGVKARICTVCKKTETKTVEKLTPTISLNTKNLVLRTKQSTKAFVVSGMAEGDYVKSIVSSKSSAVKVSGVKADGRCKLKAGKKKDSAILTITLASGLTKDIKVKVQTTEVKTKSIKNVDKKLVVKVKKTIKLTPVLNPITSTDKITYSSSNKKVATVSSKGVIKGIKNGKATITIKAGKKKFVCKVTVKK